MPKTALSEGLPIWNSRFRDLAAEAELWEQGLRRRYQQNQAWRRHD